MEVGDQEVEGDVVECRSSSECDEVLWGSHADWNSQGSKACNSGEFHRERRIQEWESCAGECFEIFDSFDEGDDQFGFALVEVGKVDGGSMRGVGGAEGHKEGFLASVLVIAIHATAFEGIKPAKCIVTESVEDKSLEVQDRAVRDRELC